MVIVQKPIPEGPFDIRIEQEMRLQEKRSKKSGNQRNYKEVWEIKVIEKE